jgi:hypothetical protein
MQPTKRCAAEATERVQRFGQAIEQELAHWRWQPVVAALQACRGIQLIHAVRIVADWATSRASSIRASSWPTWD